MKCHKCRHPLSAHYPDGCSESMWGGVCRERCRLFVYPNSPLAQIVDDARPEWVRRRERGELPAKELVR